MASEHEKIEMADRRKKNFFLLLILVVMLVFVALWFWRG